MGGIAGVIRRKTTLPDRLTSQQKSDYRALLDGRGLDDARRRKRVLRMLGVTDGRALSLRLLDGALQSRHSSDVEIAVALSHAYGLTAAHIGLLLQLVSADWHHSHENVVLALERLRAPEAVEALVHAARWVPDYLNWDESRALARKAIWVLGKTAGSDAEEALKGLVDSDDDVVRETAIHILEIRDELLQPKP
jgi:hypothetical protein